MLVVYHIFCFTPFVPSIKTQYNLGYSIIVCTSIVIMVNLYLVNKDVYRHYRIMYYTR